MPEKVSRNVQRVTKKKENVKDQLQEIIDGASIKREIIQAWSTQLIVCSNEYLYKGLYRDINDKEKTPEII